MSRPQVTELHVRIARRLIATFRPRLDVHARRLDTEEDAARLNDWQRRKNIQGRLWRVGDWTPVGARGNRAPVTVERIAAHVAGRETLGFYPLHPSGVCHSVSVDFDNHRGAKVTARDPREDFDAVVAVFMRRGVRFLANHSRGGKGYWLHLLPPEGTPARVARAVMQALLTEAGVKHIDAGGTVDALFPKQDRLHVPQGGDATASPGNLFCLPASARWLAAESPGSHFVGTDPRSLDDQAQYLEEYL